MNRPLIFCVRGFHRNTIATHHNISARNNTKMVKMHRDQNDPIISILLGDTASGNLTSRPQSDRGVQAFLDTAVLAVFLRTSIFKLNSMQSELLEFHCVKVGVDTSLTGRWIDLAINSKAGLKSRGRTST